MRKGNLHLKKNEAAIVFDDAGFIKVIFPSRKGKDPLATNADLYAFLTAAMFKDRKMCTKFYSYANKMLDKMAEDE